MSNLININMDEIFTTEEERLLSKTLSIREKIVDEMTKDGVPIKTSEIRVLNEVLNSMDSNILGKVDRRLKKTETDNQKNMVELAKTILEKDVSELEAIQVNIEVDRKLELELDETEIVEGELDLEYKPVDYDEIKSKFEGDNS